MTECERIIQQGTLPRCFFAPETMDGFLVTEQRKKIWAIELDLLLKVHRVCVKHGLRYYLIFGSLLGAVRHHGFIPWDDDLDICMPREDYEVLLTLNDEFEAPYFLQTPLTDSGFYYAHAKLRNSNTAALDYPFMYQGFNQGIFIDIIPIDKFKKENGVKRFAKINDMIIQNSTAMRLTHTKLNQRDQEKVRQYPGGDPLERYKLIQTLAKEDNHDQSCETCSLLCATLYGIERNVFLICDFGTPIEAEFSGIEVFIPQGHDNILKTIYNDYMTLPPLSSRGIWHGSIQFYPDTPYVEMLKQMCL